MKQHWNRSVAGSLLIHILLLSAVGLTAKNQLVGKPEQIIPVSLYEGDSSSIGMRGDMQSGTASDVSNGASPVQEQESAAEADLSSLFKELERPETTAENAQQDAEAPDTASGSADSNKMQGSGTGGASDSGTGTGAGEGGNGSGSGQGSGGGGEEPETDRSRSASLISYSKNYPSASRQAGEAGSVVVGVTVGADGSVTEAWIVSGSGYERLDQAALQSAYRWRFRPALNRAGEPVEGEKRVRVVYNLED
ncbi:MAG: energy transducer TonB [Acidaminococcus sp.]|jgi:TonB family protein|nr:energy transducer TonB [Acidaminococcus sp.]MCI2100825.1 energy transducer TonB [Acidaminococcus sp.]MCI2115188.1 energy transducer TonB [Acidaminococcus sp.]MCI2117263.1 energy transducer TonB [Acidaminococcus sp.]